MKDLDNFTIAVVGLGLMGGSLAMALKQNGIGRRVIGADTNRHAVTRALELGVIDDARDDVSVADVIVLAMPVRGIIAWLNQHGSQLSAECIVVDLGSTKREVVSAMERVNAQCIGGHPMCGKETAGIEAADANLFRGAKFVLTPTARTSHETLQLVRQLVTRIGAEVISMDADAHDRAVAAVSHLPYLLSVNLVNTVATLHDANALALTSSGYASMTRLAASDTRMMSDIIATNRADIVQLLDGYQTELTRLRDAIAACDEAQWGAMLRSAEQLKRNT